MPPRSKGPNPGGGSTGRTRCPSAIRRVGEYARLWNTSSSARIIVLNLLAWSGRRRLRTAATAGQGMQVLCQHLGVVRTEEVMAEEFEGRDLSAAVFWGVDLSGAQFRDVDLTDVTISHARIVNVDIDGLVDHVTINGVDVTHYVNERDSWYPLRAMLRPDDAHGMRAAWHALEQTWTATIERAQRLSDARLHESVGGEWSVVQTLRHL